MALQLQLQMSWQTSLLHHKRKNGPPLGLKNLGNSCYLNSVLQCLTYTPPLANFCLKLQHSSFCDSALDGERKRECPFCILEKRIVRSLSVDLTLDAPSKIQSCLRIYAEHFRYGRQEDAHEFLRYVIDACHNTCLRLKKLRRKGSEAFSGNTVVKEIFGGALQNQVKCLSCGNESNKVDEIMDISLDILHCNSLKEAMQKFFQPEVLDGNNKYKCENCKKLVAARKQMSILQAPNVLVIQLKRFEGIFGGKIDKEIAFEDVLVLSSFMCKESQDLHPEYTLFGSIVHSGYSAESGHYYAYIKDAMGRWYCCNDAYVTLSTLQDVLSEKVYILFFSRAKQRPGPASSALALHGLKSQKSNGTSVTNRPKEASSEKALHAKPLIESSSGSNISAISRNDRASVQMKFSLGNSGSKRVSAAENGKNDIHRSQSTEMNGYVKDKENKRVSATENGKNDIHRSQSSEMNGYVKNKENKRVSTTENGKNDIHSSQSSEMNGDVKDKENEDKRISSLISRDVEKDMTSLVNRNGFHNDIKVVPVDGKNRQASALPIENGKIQTPVIDSIKANLSERNGIKSMVTVGKQPDYQEMRNGDVNCQSNNLGLKRKSHEDSIFLFAEDAHSQAKLEELKADLEQEASSALRSCGWSDKVNIFMQSRKRLCAREAGSSQSSGNDLKKKLIADAKQSFLSQVPESLKENLIERLRSSSQKKLILGP